VKAKNEQQDRRIVENAEAIASLEERLGSLERDLDSLRSEFDVTVARLEESLRFVTPVHFDFDSAELRAADHPLLERFASVIRDRYPDAMITVEGFADPAGPVAYNQRLSERRARAVAAWLTSEGGLDARRVRSVGYGESRLVEPGASGPGTGGVENRRVAFVIEFAG
jgi:peptidoglycan-associated lipoprotein